jgi:hypothetical protein
MNNTTSIIIDSPWTQLEGQLENIAVSGDGQHIIGTNQDGTGQYRIWYRNGLDGVWTRINGQLDTVDISDNGEHIVGTKKVIGGEIDVVITNVSGNTLTLQDSLESAFIGQTISQNQGSGPAEATIDSVDTANNQIDITYSSGSFVFINTADNTPPPGARNTVVTDPGRESNIWYKNGINADWEIIPRSLDSVTVSNDREIVGVNDTNIWYTNDMGVTWTKVPGNLDTVSISGDGLTLIGTSSENIWSLTRNSIRDAWPNDWQPISGQLDNVSISGDGEDIVGTNDTNVWYKKLNVLGYDWRKIEGQLDNTAITNGADEILGTSNRNIWYTSL